MNSTSRANIPRDGHFCGICNKSFVRRDLRDRHKRRCIKNFNRPPSTKQKSCISCARSKVRCDIGNPKCSRCRDKGKECQYMTMLPSADIQVLDEPSTVLGGLGPAQMNEGYIDVGFDADSSSQNSLDDGQYFPIDIAMENPNNDDWVAKRPLESQDLILGPTPMRNWQTDPSFSSLIGLSSFFPGDITTFDGNLATELTSAPNAQGLASSPMFHSPHRAIPFKTPFPAFCTQTPILVSVLLDIPAIVVRYPELPPFIPHCLYACSNDKCPPTNISNSYCVLKAYEVAVSSSTEFVQRIMNAERERLIQQFYLEPEAAEEKSKQMPTIDILAAVHAMIFYQVVSFFDGDAAQAAVAEKQNGVFLRITRELIQRYQAMPEPSQTDWAEWRIRESITRAIHLVHVVNVVSRRRNGGHYEALDDNVILDLPLPCAKEMWKAVTEVEWARWQRKSSIWSMTVRKLMQDENVLEVFVKGLDGGTGLRMLRDCHDLTKLILACASIC